MQFPIFGKLFLSHFAAILLVSGSVGTYFYHHAVDNLMGALQSRLRNSAALISHGLDTTGLDRIRGPEDADLPFYREKIDDLRNLVRANPDIAFIYVMRKEGDDVVFVLDSDPQDPALPGTLYPHRLPNLLEGFIRPAVDDEITADRWGWFLSGYAPLPTEQGRYLVGIDMRANQVRDKFEQIRLAGLLSLASSVLLALVFSGLLSRSFTRRLRKLSLQFDALAPTPTSGDLSGRGDELDQLSRAFGLVAAQLSQKRQELEAHQASLQQAHDELELRVAKRTSELTLANERLRAEIGERKRVEQVLEQISLTDYLTGALNRRAMVSRLDRLVALDRRSPQGFSLILLDLDHFKKVNDQHGHDSGDQVLISVVDRLRQGIRPGDELGRWGGEEFLILLERTHASDAQLLAERLCALISASPIGLPRGETRVTASFGVATFHGGESWDGCLKRADEALYEAKGAGRNRVVVSAP